MGGVLKNTFVVGATSLSDGIVTENKLAAQAVSAAKMKKEGTATHVLTSNGAGAVPSYQVIPAGTQDIVKIEVCTLGSAGTSLVSAAITDSVYSAFIIDYRILSNSTSNSGVGLRLNNDSGANQYVFNNQNVTSTTLSASDRSLTYFEVQGSANPAANDTLAGTIHITNLASGYRFINHLGVNMSSTPSVRMTSVSSGYWKSTSGVTEFRLVSVSNMEAGTTFTIWGLKK